MVTIDILFQGFPGSSPTYGRLGWATVALVRAAGRNLLFDTGHCGTHRLLLQRLKERGLSPEEIHMVALSHSHWDHILGFPLFSRAELVISRRELEWAQSVSPCEAPSVVAPLVQQLASHPHLRTLEGDTELLPGVTMIDTPGHTVGHMSLLAMAEGGPVVIAQDAVKNRAEFLARKAEQAEDESASLASIDRIASLAHVVIPGHDRPFRVQSNGAEYLSELKLEIAARSSPLFEEQTVFTITFR